MILYEHPLHERIRTFLRLEHLFLRLHQLVTRVDALDHHFALATMFEIMDVAARADLTNNATHSTATGAIRPLPRPCLTR